ncbi:hypothetical protein EYF80_018867 [Liparis tanakae]|uniref:Uncharacterized protein n=1 Tax=Liparis tanakae TaxID=230148 RepID=A0A4Z2I0X2_9TELE|nr:hypothetical protein EYF80_018867 [Liparis tanakae]
MRTRSASGCVCGSSGRIEMLQPSWARTVQKGLTATAHRFRGWFTSPWLGDFVGAEMEKNFGRPRGHGGVVGVLGPTVRDQQRRSPTHRGRAAELQNISQPPVRRVVSTSRCGSSSLAAARGTSCTQSTPVRSVFTRLWVRCDYMTRTSATLKCSYSAYSITPSKSSSSTRSTMSLSRVSRWIMVLPSQNSPPSSSPKPDRYSAQVRLKATLPSCLRCRIVHPPASSSMSQRTWKLLLRRSGVTSSRVLEVEDSAAGASGPEVEGVVDLRPGLMEGEFHPAQIWAQDQAFVQAEVKHALGRFVLSVQLLQILHNLLKLSELLWQIERQWRQAEHEWGHALILPRSARPIGSQSCCTRSKSMIPQEFSRSSSVLVVPRSVYLSGAVLRLVHQAERLSTGEAAALPPSASARRP